MKLTSDQKKNVKSADNKTLLRWLEQLHYEKASWGDERVDYIEKEILKRMENHG